MNIDIIIKEFAAGKMPTGNWLENSYKNPQNFWQQVFSSSANKKLGEPKSVPFSYYNFYYDLVLRHAKSKKNIAFKWYDGCSWHELSYYDLAILSQILCEIWTKQGLKPNQLICLVMEINVFYIIALMASFKLGLRISYVPKLGDVFVCSHLQNLNPQYVFPKENVNANIHLGDTQLLSSDEIKAVYQAKNTRHKIDYLDSFVYKTNTEIAQFFSPIQKGFAIANSICSDHLYFRPLTDGIFSFFLDKGLHLMDCGLDIRQYQPVLLLCSLMRGSTYVRLEYEQFEKNAQLISNESNTVIGINQNIRSFLEKQTNISTKNWQQWFKSPTQSNNVKQWNSFVKNLNLEKIFNTNTLTDPGNAGTLLFSQRLKYNNEEDYLQSFSVLPSPATRWDQKLKNLNQSGQNASGNIGLFLPSDIKMGSDKMISVTLQQHTADYQYLNSIAPDREGQTYPFTQVLQLVEQLNFVKTCSIANTVDSLSGKQYKYNLLVCVGPGYEQDISSHKLVWQKTIQQKISAHMGQTFVVDECFFYPLYGRKIKVNEQFVVDLKWYQNQYAQGRLYQKSKVPVFLSLAAIQQWAGQQL